MFKQFSLLRLLNLVLVFHCGCKYMCYQTLFLRHMQYKSAFYLYHRWPQKKILLPPPKE